MSEDKKEVRLNAFGPHDVDVQVLVMMGTHRYPLTITGAKELRRKLGDALGMP